MNITTPLPAYRAARLIYLKTWRLLGGKPQHREPARQVCIRARRIMRRERAVRA